MATLTYRLVKGSELTYAELDGNFTNLNTAKLELGQAQASGVANGLVYLNASKQVATAAGLTFDGSVLDVSGTGRFRTSFFVYGTGDRFNVFPQVAGSGVNLVSTNNANSAYAPMVLDGLPLIFNFAGAEAARLNGTGLGIGTSSPGAKLDVVGFLRSGGNSDYRGDVLIQQFDNTETGSGGIELKADGANNGYGARIKSIFNGISGYNLGFQLRNNSAAWSTRMLLDSFGNLGIAVTPSAWISNAKALQVGSFLSAWTGSNGSANLSFGAYEGGAVNTYRYLTTGDSPTMYQQLTGQHSWFTASSGTAGNIITFTQAMTLNASGNLGVGTASPGARLDVFGGVAGTITNAQIGNASTAFVLGVDGSNSCQIRTAQSVPILFYTAGTERMRLDASGNLLVGLVTANATRLTVGGPVALQSPSSVNAATYIVAVTDSTLRFTTTNCTVTLPAAGSFPGRIIFLSNITANSVASASSNVVPLGSATAGTAILAATAGKFAVLQSDGTNWLTIFAN